MIQFFEWFRDYIVVFLVILTVVVFVHELGHYLVARWVGIRVETFSIGFGPELFGYTSKAGTRWKFSLLPLGGYVKMYGDADAASTPDNSKQYTDAERQVAYQFKTVGQRAAVAVAGPAANFIFGIAVLAVLFTIYGEPRTAAVIGDVQPGGAAAAAGLKPGDKMLKANGSTLDHFQDLQRIIRLTVGDSVTLLIERDGKQLEVLTRPVIAEVKDTLGNVQKYPMLGIVAPPNSTVVVKYDPPAALWRSVTYTGEIIGTTFKAVGQMIAGQRGTEDLGGPIRIAKTVGQASQLGLGTVVSYLVLLSINLGLINLFPIPMLDGGHLLFYGIEAVRGRPLGPRAQEYGFRIGFILVIALMVLATGNDLVDLKVWQLIKGLVS